MGITKLKDFTKLLVPTEELVVKERPLQCPHTPRYTYNFAQKAMHVYLDIQGHDIRHCARADKYKCSFKELGHDINRVITLVFD